MSTSIKDIEEKLGESKVEEIIEKDWKIAPLPSEEQLSKETHISPKARSNPNSRKNLVQYNKKTKEQKKKMLKNLQYVEVEEDIIPRDILGNYADIEAISSLMPALDILSNRSEQELYYNYIKLTLDDFDVSGLTSSDFDDVITLAINRVMTYRLLKVGAKNTLKVLEASPTLDKINKHSEKIKSGLASRRVDRIDVKNKPAFSIVNLAAHLDELKKLDFEERIKRMEKERKDYVPPERLPSGVLKEIKEDDDAD